MSGNIDKSLNKKIISNSNFIEYSKKLYNNNLTIDEKVDFLNYMVDFLTSNVTDKFSVNFIEEKLNEISATINFKLNSTFSKNSAIHVLTEGYSTGGHTKLLELFIKNTSSYFNTQSVIFLEQKVEIPNTLKEIVKTTGELIVIESDNLIDRAKQLAKISSKYEFVILHIHPHDITANLAFGNSNFTRPVIFVNHADHMFWCGVSISDLVLHISSTGKEFSSNIRGTHNNEVSQIPLIDKKNTLSKAEAREYLNIKNNKKIILSIASEYKYGKTEEEVSKFIKMAHYIVNRVENCEFILIGPSMNNKNWEGAYNNSNGKIKPLGLQPRELLDYYIISADLYIESFPMASTTAFLEVAQYGIDMFTLKANNFPPDIAKDNNMMINSIAEMQKNAIKLLSKKNKKSTIDLSSHYELKWLENFDNILKIYNLKKHKVYSFSSNKAKNTYINHIHHIIGTNILWGKVFTKLPLLLKLALVKGMLRFGIIRGFKQSIRAFRKIFI